MIPKLQEGDLVKLLDRNYGDPPGGVVVSCSGPLIWFATADGQCHVARRKAVRLIRRESQQGDQHD